MLALISSLGALAIIIGLLIDIVLNAAVIWVVANYMTSLGERTAFLKCLTCSFLLVIVGVVSILCLLIPLPGVNLIIALVVWYFLATRVIEGALEITSGGMTILILFMLSSAGIGAVLRMLD